MRCLHSEAPRGPDTPPSRIRTAGRLSGPDNPGRPCFESYPTSRAAQTCDGPASERPSEGGSRGSRFAGRCNPYRTGDGDDDGKCPRPSFPPVPYGCSTGTARALCLSRREGRDYGNTPHNRRIALPIRRRWLLLEQQARVKTEAARGFARRCRKEHPHEKAGSSRKSEEGQGEG
jgi:hypothetical protein